MFLQAGCPSCCPTNSVKALKANFLDMMPAVSRHQTKLHRQMQKHRKTHQERCMEVQLEQQPSLPLTTSNKIINNRHDIKKMFYKTAAS